MLVVVTGVSLMVQIYSLGYMRGDPSFSRYFAFMGLFTAAMLGLVLSINIVQLYAFWELVGLASYLLIGFWHDRPAAAAAAKKAFIITRIGDVGFLLRGGRVEFTVKTLLEDLADARAIAGHWTKELAHQSSSFTPKPALSS